MFPCNCKFASFALIAFAVALFSSATIVTANTERSTDQDQVVERAAAVIMRLHENASRALVNAAQDRTFGEYFHSSDEHSLHDVKNRIDVISLAVQSRFLVEEMCLIDTQGHEISRIVGKEIAEDLAINEADAPFFEPGFATPHMSVYITPIYLSPDANRWVIAYVTPIVLEGKARSILHYEHQLATYTVLLDSIAAASDLNLAVVVETGHLIYDSRSAISIEGSRASDSRDEYFETVEDFDSTSTLWLTKLLKTEPNEITASIRTVEGWSIVAWKDR